MNFFRSEDMSLFSFILYKDSAWEVMNYVGSMQCIMFVDLNNESNQFNRKFSSYVKKCDDVEHNIKYIEDEAKKFGVVVAHPMDVSSFKVWFDETIVKTKQDPSSFLDIIHNEIGLFKEQLSDQIKLYKSFFDSFVKYFEKRCAIMKASDLIIARSKLPSGGPNMLKQAETERPLKFSHLIILLSKDDSFKLRKLLYRSSRGNVVIHFLNLEIPTETYDGKKIHRCIGLIIYEESSNFSKKVYKICEAFTHEIYEFSYDINLEEEKLSKTLEETRHMMVQTKNNIIEKLKKYTELIDSSGGSLLYNYQIFVRREKYIYVELNKFKIENFLFHGLFWAATAKKEEIALAFHKLNDNKYLVAPKFFQIENHNLDPPTLIRTNEFLFPFQTIVDTYGIAAYKEINPGFFTIITFPFFFGLMLGDIMHGIYLCFLALMLCYLNSRAKALESLNALFQARYLFLLMAFFSVYCGVMYNEFASTPLNIFHSCFSRDYLPIHENDCVFPIGMDYHWQVSINDLLYTNPIKMKFSIIIGFIHMTTGIILKGLNTAHDSVEFVFEFIPQLLFMLSMFGFLVVLIFIKWLINWDGITDKAPSLTSYFSDIYFQFGSSERPPLVGDGSVQKIIAQILIAITFVCIPWMMFIKPLILRKIHSKDVKKQKTVEKRISNPNLKAYKEKDSETPNESNKKLRLNDELNAKDPIENFLKKEKEDFDFGKIFMFSLLENMEFLMGSISNTASYLRLWALSLSHSELSRIFFSFTMGMAIRTPNPNFFVIFILNIILQIVSFAILICMGALEAFLHALRLHWIEFQNKFYKATGYAFVAFDLLNLTNLLARETK